MVPVIREFLGKEEVERRETFDWVEPVGREDVDDEDLELYDTLTVRRKKAADLTDKNKRGLFKTRMQAQKIWKKSWIAEF